MSEGRVRLVDLLVLTALVVAVFTWPLVAPPIGTHGEAREGLVVQDIVQHGRWILPHRNGELPSKPPLFHWIAAVVGSVVGLSDAIVRVPSALAAWLVFVLVYGLGVAANGRPGGWLAVGALAGMHSFVESATEARVDMLFTACVTAALVGFLHWYRSDERWARVGCYLAVAGAVLTKGPAGAVLPALVIVVFLARERRLDRLLALWSWRLVAAVLLVDLGWYALASYAGGADFLARQIFHENVDRFVGRGVFGLHGGRSRLAMLENLSTDLLPWNLVLLWAAVRWWRGEREDTLGRFLHTWWITILVFFTVAYGKRGIYLLPLYPAIAALAGRALAEVFTRLAADAGRSVHPALAAVLRRVAPARPARALVAGVVVIDLAVVLVGQIVRVHRAGRASLVPFADDVRTHVRADAALVAGRTLDESDLLVMAYRLAREIPRVVAGTDCVPGAYRLVTADGRWQGDAAALATSRRRGVNVALVQETAATCPLALQNEADR